MKLLVFVNSQFFSTVMCLIMYVLLVFRPVVKWKLSFGNAPAGIWILTDWDGKGSQCKSVHLIFEVVDFEMRALQRLKC